MLSQFYNRVVSRSHVFIKACHTGPQRDPFALFFQKDVQEMLKVLTRLDLQKVFRPRMDGTPVEPPIYQFMTDEELEKSRADALKRAEKLLQMPPVVNVRKEIDEVLSVDPALQGYDECKYVFTDITYGIKNEDRVIAVRETDGTLRSAKWDERSRLNEIYFPLPGRQMLTPKMFEGEFLQNLLDQQKYEFILDRACVQFEPDDPIYHNVTKAVYDTVNHNNHFEHLRSTRHFGPMVFHFVCNKEIDNLLLDNINTGHIEEAVTLIQLYHKVHPTAKSAGISPNDKQDLKFVENYALLDSPIKIRIQRAIRTFEELQNVKREANKGMERSHKLEASANAI